MNNVNNKTNNFCIYFISNWHRSRLNYRHSKNGLYHIITGVAFNSQTATQTDAVTRGAESR